MACATGVHSARSAMLGSASHGGFKSWGSGVSSVNWKTGGAGSDGGGEGDAEGGGSDGDGEGDGDGNGGSGGGKSGGGPGLGAAGGGDGASTEGEDDKEGEGSEGGNAGGDDGGLTQVPHWPSSGNQYGVPGGHSHLATHCSVHTGFGLAQVWLHAEPQEFHNWLSGHSGVDVGAADSPGLGGGRNMRKGGEEGAKVKPTSLPSKRGVGGKGGGKNGGDGGRFGGMGVDVSCKIHQIGIMYVKLSATSKHSATDKKTIIQDAHFCSRLTFSWAQDRSSQGSPVLCKL